MLESRGGESIKGAVVRDQELIELGRRVDGGARACAARRPIQVFRDPDIGLGITDVNTRFGGAFPAPVYAALPGRSYPELIVAHGRRRAGRAARRRVPRTARPSRATTGSSSSTSSCEPTGRDIVPGGPPAPGRRGAASRIRSPCTAALADPPAAPAARAAHRRRLSRRPTPAARAGLRAGARRTRRACANCGAPLATGQDWCLQCGAGAPDSLGSRAPGWRSAAVVLTALAAARRRRRRRGLRRAQQRRPQRRRRGDHRRADRRRPRPPRPYSRAADADARHRDRQNRHAHDDQTDRPARRLQTAEDPAHGAHADARRDIAVEPRRRTPTPTRPKTPPNSRPCRPAKPHPQALLLDTNAASTYNPYNYPPANFGDPSLAIDGDASTGWTAQVEPAVAPKLAEGAADRPEDRAQALGARAHDHHARHDRPGLRRQRRRRRRPRSPTPPGSRSARRSPSKRHARIKLGGATPPRRPPSSPTASSCCGSVRRPPPQSARPQAPGRVSVNELELFAAKKR